MTTYTKKISAFFSALLVTMGTAYSQEEYDDLYFNSSDRLEVKEVAPGKQVVQNTKEIRNLPVDPQVSYSSKNVNPEYVSRYQSADVDETALAEDEYFDAEYANNYNDNNYQAANNYMRDADVAIRDRYGNTTYFRDFSDVYWSDPFYYEGTIFDPFYSPFSYGYGYHRPGFRPFRSGWNVSISFGNTWGWRNNWVSYGYGWGSRYYDPFYDPFYGYSYYDPFYSPYSRYGYGHSYYGYGYPYRNVVVINNYETRSDRVVRRGPGDSRSRVVRDDTRTRRVSATTLGDNINTGRTSQNSRISGDSPRSRYINTRNNTGEQSRFYRRSRETNTEATTSRSHDSRSRSSSNYSTESRSNTRSYRSSDNNSRSNPSYNRSRSESRPSYNTPSRSRSESNYTPSRSRSNSSYSTPSRSRSSSSYSTPSRSRSSYSSGSSSSSSRSSSSSSSRTSRRGGR